MVRRYSTPHFLLNCTRLAGNMPSLKKKQLQSHDEFGARCDLARRIYGSACAMRMKSEQRAAGQVGPHPPDCVCYRGEQRRCP